MKLRHVLALVVPAALVFAAAPNASADDPEMSLKDKKQWAEMTKEIEEKAAQASEACGTKITAGFDIPSFKGTDLFKESPTAKCRDAVSTLSALCASDTGKEAVKKNVATVTCKKSTEGTKVTRDKKALTVHIDHKNPYIKGKEKGSYSWKSALEEIL